MSLLQKPVNVSKRLVYRIEKWLYLKNILHTNGQVFPDFLCAGVEKAGTTWLYENLRCHPELFLPDRKELNYFSNDYRFYGFPLSYYSSYFQNTDKVKGEVTPCENMPLERIQFMKKIMPQLKIILIIRNPIERAWSAALMHLVSAQNRRFEDITEEEFLALFDQTEIIAKGKYEIIIPKWKNVFSKDQLYLCFYDDLLTNPKLFLEGIFDFLGVSKKVDWGSFKVNEIVNPSSKELIYENINSFLKNQYKDSIAFVENKYSVNWKL